MIVPIDIILVIMLICDLILAVENRLGGCIRIVAVQGCVLGLLPLALGFRYGMTVDLLILSVAGIVLRGILFPRLLHSSMVNAGVTRELRPLVGYSASLVLMVLLLVLSIWLSTRFTLPHPELHILSPVAFMTIFSGTFLIVGRRIAIMQIIGYILLENGIFCLSLTLVEEVPLLVEFGVSLDIFVAVFVMSVATNKIREEFDHLNVERLDSLKG